MHLVCFQHRMKSFEELGQKVKEQLAKHDGHVVFLLGEDALQAGILTQHSEIKKKIRALASTLPEWCKVVLSLYETHVKSLSNTCYVVSKDHYLAQPKRRFTRGDEYTRSLGVEAGEYTSIGDHWVSRSQKIEKRPFPSFSHGGKKFEARVCADARMLHLH